MSTLKFSVDHKIFDGAARSKLFEIRRTNDSSTTIDFEYPIIYCLVQHLLHDVAHDVGTRLPHTTHSLRESTCLF